MNPDAVLERVAIAEMLYRYASAVDRRHWEDLSRCFADQVRISGPHFDLRGSSHKVAQTIAESLKSQFDWTMHNVHNFLYTVSDDRAQGEVYCLATHVYAQQGGYEKLDWYVRYQDQLIKMDGHWLISHRHLVVKYETRTPVIEVPVS